MAANISGVLAHTAVTVGNTSTAVLSAETNRTYALFINDSDETIYMSIDGTAAAANDGIRLNANGGSYEMTMGAGNVTANAVVAICASGSKKLLVTQAA
jgi:hypothetical protein